MWSLANPSVFLAFVRRVLPGLWLATAACFAIGLWMVFNSPPDYQQGETVKIMYIHVPSAWLSTLIYGVMAIASLGTLVWRHPLADAAQKAAAPLGAGFTFVCLATGSLWGKPMWGTYWVWDARLTSVLVLFILYLGLIALWRSFDDPGQGRARRGDPDPGRQRQSADHKILGRLVEHPPSAGVGVPHGRPDDCAGTALAAARDGNRLHAAVRLTAPDGDPQRDPPAARRPPHPDRRVSGRRARSRDPLGARALMAAIPHIEMIVAAYAVAAAVIGAMIAYVLIDYRSLSTQVAALERKSGEPGRDAR